MGKSGTVLNKEYWEGFYANNLDDIKGPSSFALFCFDRCRGNESLVDLCCGNGRDSYYFATKLGVVGVDANTQPLNIGRASFVRTTIEEYMLGNTPPDIVYTRFGFHAIAHDAQEQILNWCGRRLWIECRSDKGEVCSGHIRNLVNYTRLLSMLMERDYEVEFCQEARNLALYRGENPVIIRVLAKRN